MTVQELSKFKLPDNFRGRSALIVQLWWLVQASIFQHSPQFAYGFRRWILRLFGASIGNGAIIRPSVTVTYPWKVIIGEHAWIGDDVVLYSLGQIDIGAHTVISQRCYICTGDHDYSEVDFPIRSRRISIDRESWIASDVFIAPGVHIGKGVVIGARSTVFSDMPSEMICYGYPCKPVKKRLTQRSRTQNKSPKQ